LILPLHRNAWPLKLFTILNHNPGFLDLSR
jgi:hypothetical protein